MNKNIKKHLVILHQLLSYQLVKQQLDDAMDITISDKGVDKTHVGFNQYVDKDTIQHFLYRDFPDEQPKQ